MWKRKPCLSFLTAPITLYPQILVNKRVQDADALLEIPEVKAVMKEAEKDMGEKGRLLLRTERNRASSSYPGGGGKVRIFAKRKCIKSLPAWIPSYRQNES